MQSRVYVIGMGPGHPDYVLPIAISLIEKSDILVGGKRHLDAYAKPHQRTYPIQSNLMALMDIIRQEQLQRQVAVLLSGEPGFYGMLTFMRRYFCPEELLVIPGISAFQYLMAKIGEPWQESALASLHGRECDFLALIQQHKTSIFLTDHRRTPHWIAEQLINKNGTGVEMIVGEKLSYPEEKIVRASPADILKHPFFDMATVVINHEKYPI